MEIDLCGAVIRREARLAALQVPNASPTADAANSDMYGAAVFYACDQIKARMKHIAAWNPHSSFAELTKACHMERIDLSAHGFYITPDIGFDWEDGKGSPFSYFTFEVAFAEVKRHSLEIFTQGKLTLSWTLAIPLIQLLMLNSEVGLGWIALEELKWGDSDHKWIRPGHSYTSGPGTYKIPTANDIPLKLKVSLLKGVQNTEAIHSSKAVGEPPLFLASAVLFAIKDAIMAVRAEEGYHDWFPLDDPATLVRIRMACVDNFTKQFTAPEFHPKRSIIVYDPSGVL
ncbi:hypothetical protein ZIOFF_033023 [Zingiber officinale]|uniref:Aldehyde oxidase/xanthine dehydrogenase second molybdopterin binding domain-containing protein n=1 Tax=Zingiber officinale TaxID=94328 RepID=A0A8J5GJC0_ZINOF|nr:hypothetical protein ZIOFF_033023 [Zingiber officinale]